MKKDNKATNRVVIILAVLRISYCPACIAAIFIIVRFSDQLRDDLKEFNAQNVVVFWCTMSIVLLASLFNPINYCWRSKKLRCVFLEILHFGQS